MIFHSDQGSQYASNDFVNLLKAFKVIQSMSRPGDVYDILFASYKLECVPNKGFTTRQQAWQETFEYTDAFYNRQLPHAALGYLTPANTLLVYLNHFSTRWGTVHVVPSVSSWARNGRTSSTTPSSSRSQEYAIVF